MIIIFAWLYIVSMILIKTRSRTSPHLWTGCVALDTMFAATSFHYGYLISASLSRAEPSWYYGGASSAIASWPVCEDLLRFLFLMFCWLSYQPQPAAEVESGDTSTCHQHSGQLWPALSRIRFIICFLTHTLSHYYRLCSIYYIDIFRYMQECGNNFKWL